MSECDKYLATFKSPIRRLRHYIISMPAVEHVREIVQYFVNENHPHIMKLILYYLRNLASSVIKTNPIEWANGKKIAIYL